MLPKWHVLKRAEWGGAARDRRDDTCEYDGNVDTARVPSLLNLSGRHRALLDDRDASSPTTRIAAAPMRRRIGFFSSSTIEVEHGNYMNGAPSRRRGTAATWRWRSPSRASALSYMWLTKPTDEDGCPPSSGSTLSA